MEINKFLEGIFDISPDIITLIVIMVCIALAVFSLISNRLRDISPALMVSAGIIGTFWGTFIALSGFETGVDENGVFNYKVVVDNIPVVLKGMTSAFLTSLIGLLFAFVSKIGFRFLPESPPTIFPTEENMLRLLEEIKDGIVGEGDKSLSSQMSILRAEYRDSAKDLKQSISGDGESSVTFQLIKLKNENNDGFKTLDGRLNELANAIKTLQTDLKQSISGDSESSVTSQLTKLRTENSDGFKTLDSRLNGLADAIRIELVNAIEKQIGEQLEKTNELLRNQLGDMLKRIEDALIKQFGETFKQFNEATQAIKKWQEDHLEEVEKLKEAFKTTATGIEKIRADCESIPATMKELQTLMGELDERLKAFKEMKEQAKLFFPEIEKYLNQIGDNLRESAKGFSGLDSMIREIISEIKNASDDHQKEIRKMVGTVKQTCEDCVTHTQTALTELRDAHVAEINGITDSIAQKWGENMLGIAKTLADEIKNAKNRNS